MSRRRRERGLHKPRTKGEVESIHGENARPWRRSSSLIAGQRARLRKRSQ